MTATDSAHLLVAKHVHVAFVDGVFVFLDVEADRYSCLERGDSAGFARLVGLELPATSPTAVATRGDAELASELTRSGILTDRPAEGRRAVLLAKPEVLAELEGCLVDDLPSIRLRDLWRFGWAFLTARARLGLTSFASMTRHVSRRRARAAGKATRRREIADAVEVFKRLKPLVSTGRENCLFNSLFLIEFLARYRLYPDWHFGVRFRPFYAHCWLQVEDTVCDESADTVGQNVPIMRA